MFIVFKVFVANQGFNWVHGVFYPIIMVFNGDGSTEMFK